MNNARKSPIEIDIEKQQIINVIPSRKRIKTAMIVACIVLSSCTSGLGQLIKELGVKSGVTFSSYESRFRPHTGHPEFIWISDSRVGYAISIWADLMKSQNWDYSLSLSYDQRRSALEAPSGVGGTAVTEHAFQYGSLLNSVRGKIPLSTKLTLFGICGVRIDQLLGHSQSNPYPFDFSYLELKKLRLGLNAGAGVTFRVSEASSIGVEITRNFNITKAINDDRTNSDRLPGFFFELDDRTYFLFLQYSHSLTK